MNGFVVMFAGARDALVAEPPPAVKIARSTWRSFEPAGNFPNSLMH
jgi:hypothetical protein